MRASTPRFPECGDSCGCRCHRIAEAKGRNRKARKLQRNWWSPPVLTTVKLMNEQGYTMKEIQAALLTKHHEERTEAAIRHKIMQLGQTGRQAWLTEADVRRVLGVSRRRTLAWRASGVLPMERHGAKLAWWRIPYDQFVAFVQRNAGKPGFPAPSTVKDPTIRAWMEVRQREMARTGRTDLPE